ncbi:nucleotide-binding domain-containing protein [Macroventuria anomochaeta]|uniref:Nucleotide-binding domain-containing protein n=1 Tax=Macroventuria anomochaeta TaxID=301207 RepID=A0ACB6S5N4_9PLEO|nr:nucleotide-binding domain-containing protein [Macroventuria anomochaeta]KAF2629491.1 nucleotide-binding domain-containing protein [Macroventuria anomochaeta]
MRFQYFFVVASLSQYAFAADPGLPMDNPTISFWQLPPNPDLADLQSKTLPRDVDVVIIGSGITGTGVARWLLRDGSQERPLRIAMVEARQSCSGATGRNAGHIRPLPWDYVVDKPIIGAADAAKIARLKARHYSEYAKAAKEDLDADGRDAAEVRAMDSIDAWFTDDAFNEVVQKLEVVKQELPDIGKEWTIISGDEAREKTLMPGVVGIAVQSVKSGGAMWPYRFVTNMQAALLKKYPSFSLDTHTPVLNITSNTSGGQSRFDVETSRGIIRTRHVVHAAGAWAPHLLRNLEKQITQARWHMGATAAGDRIPDAGHWPAVSGNSSQPGGREFGLWRDYYSTLTQLPKSGLFIVGGGVAGEGEEVPPWDDHTPVEPVIASYLNGMMPTFFGYDNWGAERPATPPQEHVYPGRTKALWTGVDAISWDSYPLVGALPTNVTGREAKDGAEWICGVYSGDGMPSAWMAAKGLSTAILSAERNEANQTWPEWFPNAWIVSAERLSKPCVNSTDPSLGNLCQ